MQSKTIKIVSVVMLLSLILGCGGGGGGSSAENIVSNPVTASGNVTLQWDAPTNNTDGSDYTDPAGFIIYYGTSSGNYTYSVDTNNFSSAVISDLASGTWYFAISAYNELGIESDLSEEFSMIIL